MMDPVSEKHPRRNDCLLRGLLTALALMLGTPNPASSQVDRKGFILNLGLGVGQVTTSVSFRDFTASTAQTAVSTDLKIGYAPNDLLLVYYSNDAAFYGDQDADSDDLLASGVSGLGITYFLMPGEKALFLSGVVGIAARHVISSHGSADSETGSGLSLGGGYEFSAHWLLDADIVLGRFDDDVSIRTIRVGLAWLRY